METPQLMMEAAKLRLRMQMQPRLRLEVLAALSRVFREYSDPVTDELLSELVLAVPGELVGEARTDHGAHAPLRDNKPPPSPGNPKPLRDNRPPPGPLRDDKPPPSPGGDTPPPGPLRDNKPPPSPGGDTPPRKKPPRRPRHK
jgi:hypothetical protein